MNNKYGTGFSETEALVSAVHEDQDQLEEVVSRMHPGERLELIDACTLVTNVCVRRLNDIAVED